MVAVAATDGHGEKLDFDVPVTVVRGDDFGRHFQAVRSDPGRGRENGGGDGCFERWRLRRFAAPALPGRFGSGERRRETPATHVPHVAHRIAARALARRHVLQAHGFDVGRQPHRIQGRLPSVLGLFRGRRR